MYKRFKENEIDQKKIKKIRFIKQISTIIIIIIFVILTIKFYPFIYSLKDEANRKVFEQNIKNMGVKGVVILTALQVSQVVLAILPGQPIEIVAGMAYGIVLGTTICTIGIFIGTAIVFYLVRALGKSFALLFIKEESLEKVENMKLFKDQKKLKFFLFFMFFVPIFPKDMFVYMGGLTKLKPKDFITLATVSRIPGQLLGVYVGASISGGSYIMPIIVLTLVLIASIVLYYAVKNKKIKLE